jgi:DNA-binding XRE family transcriptional regulator
MLSFSKLNTGMDLLTKMDEFPNKTKTITEGFRNLLDAYLDVIDDTIPGSRDGVITDFLNSNNSGKLAIIEGLERIVEDMKALPGSSSIEHESEPISGSLPEITSDGMQTYNPDIAAQLRKDAHLTQQGLANLLGVRANFAINISAYERRINSPNPNNPTTRIYLEWFAEKVNNLSHLQSQTTGPGANNS